MLAISFALLLAGLTPLQPDSTVAYVVFRSDGTPSSFEELYSDVIDHEVLFIGETHDDSIAHVLEYKILTGVYEKLKAIGSERPLFLGLEMFERDVQAVLDEYLNGQIRERDFLAASRPWSNYEADYRPMVEFAREHGIPVVASNAPARYVSLVGRNGPDSLQTLSPQARSWLPPFPFEVASEAYASKFRETMRRMMVEMAAARDSAATGQSGSPDSTQQMMKMMAARDSAAAGEPKSPDSTPKMPAQRDSTASSPRHGSQFMLDAQNLRDASMGHAIASVLDHNPDALVIHVNGSFHSDGAMGTAEHVTYHRPNARMLVISIVDEGYPKYDAENMAKRGDYIVLTPSSLLLMPSKTESE